MLEISHISKTFNPGTANAKKAIDDLSLSVAEGDFITVIGANGAGKSTLFNAIPAASRSTEKISLSCPSISAPRASADFFRIRCAAPRPA